MLFSMKKTEVFPIDVWMRRVMGRIYGMSERNLSGMQDYAVRNFGEYGGIAQQYLFNYIRKLKRDNPPAYERLGLEAERPDGDNERTI
jgi:N-glycosylase/DNA lyase